MPKYTVDSQGNLIPLEAPAEEPQQPTVEETELEEEPEADPEREKDDWDDIFTVKKSDIRGDDSVLPDPTDNDISGITDLSEEDEEDIFTVRPEDVMGDVAPRKKKKAYKITRKGRGYQPPPETSLGGIR